MLFVGSCRGCRRCWRRCRQLIFYYVFDSLCCQQSLCSQCRFARIHAHKYHGWQALYLQNRIVTLYRTPARKYDVVQACDASYLQL